jgi:hypothetical protein
MELKHNPLDRKNLEDSVFSLESRKKQLSEEKKRIEKTSRCLEVCSLFFGGILKTHSCKDIPKHDSGESLFFFKDQNGESVLIEELKPSPDLMPEMKRIPLAQAMTKEMTVGGLGYVIQRVLFACPFGRHELMLICFDRSIFQKI